MELSLLHFLLVLDLCITTINLFLIFILNFVIELNENKLFLLVVGKYLLLCEKQNRMK